MSFNDLQSNLVTQNRYTRPALTDRIKKILATTKLDIREYISKIGKHKKIDPTKSYYDYDLELDFSIDININIAKEVSLVWNILTLENSISSG